MLLLLSTICLTNLVFEGGVLPVDGGFFKSENAFSWGNPYLTVATRKNPAEKEARDEPPEIIEYGDYKSETHNATTKDGYGITMFRILPKDKTRGGKGMPVYIGHGLLSSAADWLMLPHEQALPFQLAHEGYDVWLGNSRANGYSSWHKKYNNNAREYWNFSVHEMGQYDVPAVIDHIIEKTGFQKINYIGYSMSTTSFFICMSLSENAAYNGKINKMVALAPAIYLNHIKSPAKAAKELNDRVQLEIHQNLLNGQLLPWKLVESLQGVTPICHINPDVKAVDKFTDRVCQNIIHFVAGNNTNETDNAAVERAEDYSPSSTSARTLIHFIQFFRNKEFQQYDWEEAENLERYKQATPPVYNLRQTNATMLFMFGDKDDLTVPEDVIRTIKVLEETNPTLKNITVPGLNHLDFVYGKNASEKVYKPLINWFNE